MKTKLAIKLAGSASALADLLGIHRSAVAHWDKNIPPLRAYQLKEKKPEWFVVEEAKPMRRKKTTPVGVEA